MVVYKEYRDITREFYDLFAEGVPLDLPPKRPFEFETKINDNKPPPVKLVIRLWANTLAELSKQLDHLLGRGLNLPSTSPLGALVLFIKTKNRELRMVFDYGNLNKKY